MMRSPSNVTAEIWRICAVPVPPDDFLYAWGMAQRAAEGTLHGADIPPPQGPGLYLTNHPLNRAMMAVRDALSHLSEDEKQSAMWRMMHLLPIALAAAEDEHLREHFHRLQDGEIDGMSDEFLRAYAQCQLRYDDLAPAGQDITADFEELRHLIRTGGE